MFRVFGVQGFRASGLPGLLGLLGFRVQGGPHPQFQHLNSAPCTRSPRLKPETASRSPAQVRMSSVWGFRDRSSGFGWPI